jgi:hypothetical protein
MTSMARMYFTIVKPSYVPSKGGVALIYLSLFSAGSKPGIGTIFATSNNAGSTPAGA